MVILAIASLMRSPITTLPLVLRQLANGLSVSQENLGILTTLPLIMFLLFSNFAPVPLAKIGIKKSMALALLLLTVGSLMRLVITMPMMLIGTGLIGIGIAHLNVFMPSFIKAYFPTKIDVYTTLYSFAINFGSGGFNLITTPVVKGFGWQAILVLLAVVPTMVLGLWLWVSRFLPEKLRRSQTVISDPTTVHGRSIWTNIRAWPFVFTFGGQSVLNYTIVAWLPVLMAYHNVSAGKIGLVMAVYSLMGIPVYLTMPRLLTQLGSTGIRVLILLAGGCGVAAGGMLFFQNTAAVTFWLAEGILVGAATCFFFIYSMTMFGLKTNDPMMTAKLSGMAQAGGYFVAALGPSLYGIAYRFNPVGTPQNIVYIFMIVLATAAALIIQRIKRV